MFMNFLLGEPTSIHGICNLLVWFCTCTYQSNPERNVTFFFKAMEGDLTQVALRDVSHPIDATSVLFKKGRNRFLNAFLLVAEEKMDGGRADGST